MLKILIIEDEEPAARRLIKLIKEVHPETELLATLDSIQAAISWFAENQSPDLIFSDIQLSDGISFEIFRTIPMNCPVIFTTAFDQYAIDAFKLNSIDYLLKPVKKEELKYSLDKFFNHRKMPPADFEKLFESYYKKDAEIKQRFVVKYGEHLKTISVDDIAYFHTEDKITFLTLREGRHYVVDFNLDQLDSMLDKRNFFRINRQFIISIRSIAEMFTYSKSRVLIKLNPPSKHETIVSAERSAAFKAWLGS